ncbi:MAG: rhomboid family intramembrane serine protease [Bacteroidetes bacterium]|nr:rhomboid family intramembrane serine protease [Bacteroidota bacterium]
MSITDDIKRTFSSANNLTRLIYINIGVFLFFLIVSVISFLFDNSGIESTILRLFAIPASLKVFLLKPWTLITYMFTHKDIWHILFNMLWLYWFGRIFLDYLDQRKLVAVYLMGGIIGAIVYVLSFNIFPVFTGIVSESVAIGASASVMAVVIATATYVPDYSIHFFLIGQIKIKYVALAILILTSFMDFSVNSGGKLAHIGGALLGFLYIEKLKKGKDPGRRLNSIIDTIVTFFKPRPKMKVTHKKTVTDYDFNKMKAEHQAKINTILDKISKGGYDSLTKEEKDMLFRESQKKN